MLRAALPGAVLALGLLSLVTAAQAADERRVALVIGNAAYETTAALANPRNDATDIAASLKRLGFEVVDGQDLSKRAMEQALGRFSRIAQGADAAVVFYAGHGLQYQGQNYLVPVDAKLEDEFSFTYEMLKLEEVLIALERAKGVRILMLDACRNNPFAEKLSRMLSRTRDFGLSRGLAKIDRTEGMVIAYATQANQVAADGRGRNSPFTGALVKEIEEPGVEVATLFRRVARAVNQETGGRQTPELSLSLLGEFYFNRAETDQQAWRRLRGSSEARAYEDFIARFPNSFLVDDARARLDGILRERQAREQGERERQLKAELARLESERKKAADELAMRDKAERERTAREQAERDKLVNEQAAREKAAREQTTKTATAESEQLTKLEAERRKLTEELATRDRTERERLARDQTERDRLARDQRRRDEELTKLESERRQVIERLNALEKEQLARTERADASQPRQEAALQPPSSQDGAAKDAPAKPTAPALSGSKLVAAIQGELKRVGCFAGKADEKWTGAATTRSVAEFAKHASLTAPDLPTNDFLDALKSREGRVCPIVCSVREVVRGGVCVAKTCPAGERLTAGGDCVVPAPKAPVKANAEVAAPRRAEPEPRAARPSGGGARCFTFQGKQFCE
jgi:uncharacterized caspase-like protein